jgi:hypothetical protein
MECLPFPAWSAHQISYVTIASATVSLFARIPSIDNVFAGQFTRPLPPLVQPRDCQGCGCSVLPIRPSTQPG